MNAAIIATLEAGFYLLISDRDDSLAWERSQHDGWYIGLYRSEDDPDPARWKTSDESSAEQLLRLVDRVLTCD